MRKFECKKCGKKFSSEEETNVECPYCGSDNVDYASFRVPYKFIGVLVSVIIVVFLCLQVDWNALFTQENTESEMKEILVVKEDSVQEELDKEIEEMGIVIPPSIEGISNMELDDNNHYNCIVVIRHAEDIKKDYCVLISDQKTNKVVAKSKDGVFKGVPYSDNEGKYYAYIADASSETPISEKTEITGFKKVELISHKLSVEQLQKLINNQDSSLLGTDNKYISPICQLKYTNFPKGAGYDAPDNLSDVFELIDYGTWTSVTVKSLEYDETKHISLITLKINAPSRPNFDN